MLAREQQGGLQSGPHRVTMSRALKKFVVRHAVRPSTLVGVFVWPGVRPALRAQNCFSVHLSEHVHVVVARGALVGTFEGGGWACEMLNWGIEKCFHEPTRNDFGGGEGGTGHSRPCVSQDLRNTLAHLVSRSAWNAQV